MENFIYIVSHLKVIFVRTTLIFLNYTADFLFKTCTTESIIVQMYNILVLKSIVRFYNQLIKAWSW